MKKYSKGSVYLKQTVRLVLLILCGITLGVNVYLINANSLVGNQMPMPFGYGAAVVLSGSMEPEMSKGDLILVAEADFYRENDIVVFQDGHSLVVHRIIAVDGDNVTTKGDANPVADAPVSFSAIKGKVLWRIPYVGIAVNFLKTPVGIVCLIAAAILLLEIPRRNEKKKDAEERQKIIDEIKRLKES